MKKRFYLLIVLILALPFIFVACETEPCLHLGERIYYPQGNTEATCYSAATQRVGCKDCGEVWTETIGNPLPHASGTWKETKEATCTIAGERTKYCDECHAVMETQEIPVLAHIASNWIVTLEETCSTSGTKIQKCTACEKELVSEVIEAQHKTVAMPAVAATCTQTGLTEGSKCSRCNLVFTEQEVIATLAHQWVDDPAVEPTCASYGYTEGSHCKGCQKWQVKPTRISKLPHTPVADAAVEPTCTSVGYTAGSHCSVCRTDIVAQRTISSLGHDFSVFTNDCSRCYTKQYDEITSVTELCDEYDEKHDAVVYLEYATSKTEVGTYYVTLASTVNYFRLVGDVNQTYKFYIILSDRTTPITIDFVNANVTAQKSIISCNSAIDLHVGFYGEKCSLLEQKAANGADASITGFSYSGDNGSNANSAIYAPNADIKITFASSQCTIQGGEGGNGGKGMGATGPQTGGDGGNGGNGAVAIEASSIVVSVDSGYTKDNLTITGGAGGTGGKGGSGFLWTDDGRTGTPGNNAGATNVTIIYN